MNYKIALYGPQGSGKGTQGEKLAEYLQVPLIVTGNIFRLNIKEKTELGSLAQKYINKGDLVPDEVTIKMILERLSQKDCQKGFVLDGYPRSLVQATALDKAINLTHVLVIHISDKEAVRRIANRRSCPHCGRTYHLAYKPPKKDSICDHCQTSLVQREDDTKEALIKRLNIYHQESEPILNHYEKINILHKINGEQLIEKVWQDIKQIFIQP